ncbi:MAG: MFS transporter, partial [Chloroflexota bacterium]
SRTRGALWIAGPILPVFMLSHFSHHIVTGALTPLLPQLRVQWDLDYSAVGMLVAAYTLTYGVMQIPAAALANRVGRRRLISVGLFGIGACGLLMGFVNSYWQLAAMLIAIGLFGSTYHAPASAFLSLTFKKTTLGRSLGMHTIGGSGSLLITPVLAVSIAYLFNDWRAAYIGLGIAPILAGFLILTATRRQEEAHIRAAAKAGGKRLPILEIARVIGLLVIIAMVASMLSLSVSSFFPVYLVDKHHVSPEVAGLMAGLIAGGGVVGAPLGGALSDKFGRPPVITATLLLAGPLLYLFTIVPFGVPMLALVVLYGLILSARMPVMESVIADVVPVAQRGTALGVYFFLSQETSAVAAPLIGSLMDQIGADPTFVGLAVVAGAAGVLALLITKSNGSLKPAAAVPEGERTQAAR